METSLPTPICQGPTVNLPEGNRYVSMIIWPWGMQEFGDIRDGLASFVSLTDSQEASASKNYTMALVALVWHGETNKCWLVVEPPLWKIWLRQLGLWFPIYGKNGKIKFMFQTTNQWVIRNWMPDIPGRCWAIRQTPGFWSSPPRPGRRSSSLDLLALGKSREIKENWWFCDLDQRYQEIPEFIHKFKRNWNDTLKLYGVPQRLCLKNPNLRQRPHIFNAENRYFQSMFPELNCQSRV